MKRRLVNPVKIGAFVVGGLVILVGAVLMIGSGRIFRRTYPFVSYFDGSVNGLRAGASVKFKGVEIGKVDMIKIPDGLTRLDQPIALEASDSAFVNVLSSTPSSRSRSITDLIFSACF